MHDNCESTTIFSRHARKVVLPTFLNDGKNSFKMKVHKVYRKISGFTGLYGQERWSKLKKKSCIHPEGKMSSTSMGKVIHINLNF